MSVLRLKNEHKAAVSDTKPTTKIEWQQQRPRPFDAERQQQQQAQQHQM